jgi:hypothetical protein
MRCRRIAAVLAAVVEVAAATLLAAAVRGETARFRVVEVAAVVAARMARQVGPAAMAAMA